MLHHLMMKWKKVDVGLVIEVEREGKKETILVRVLSNRDVGKEVRCAEEKTSSIDVQLQ